jgi:hypothetical protein
MNKTYLTLLIIFSFSIISMSGCTSPQVLSDIDSIEKEISAIKNDSDILKSNLGDNVQMLKTEIQESDDQLEKKINEVEKEISAIKNDSDLLKANLDDNVQMLKTDIQKSGEQLEKKINEVEKEISAIKNDSDLLKSNLDDSVQMLKTDIQKSGEQPEDSVITMTSDLHETVSRQRPYWIIAVLILLLMVTGVFVYLKHKIVQLNNILNLKIDYSIEGLKNDSIQLDAKLIQIIENQLKEGKQQVGQEAEPDDSLPIKVCEEIQRMRNRMKHMDQDDQATKVFSKRLASLEEKLNSMGYEIVNLENTPYLEGMTVEARFISNENMDEGEEIITRVIKPQINFNGVLIKAADVEVSQGSKVN